MKRLLPLLLLGAYLPASACTLTWDYDTSLNDWIDGFRIYQDGIQVGTTNGAARSASCTDLGLVPGPGPITGTAYRGSNESPHSDPAAFQLTAPGLTVRISVP